MRVVYIAHRLSAPTAEDMAVNRMRAAEWCAWVSTTFHVATVADWIILSRYLPETSEYRAWGLKCDKALVERCDELWMVGPGVSSGMSIEAQHARQHLLPVYDLTGLPRERAVVERALAEQGWCLGCGCDILSCRTFQTSQRKCCPDCSHGRALC